MSSIFYQPGNYVGEVKEQRLGETKTGKPQLVIRFKVLGTPLDDGEYAPVSVQYDRTIYMVITEGTMPYVADKLKRLGYAGKGFGPLDPDHANHQSFVGQMIDVWCKHEADQEGNAREKWDIARGPSALNVNPLPSKKVRELDALFGKSLLAPDSESTPAHKSNHSGPDTVLAGTEITDDDIPF